MTKTFAENYHQQYLPDVKYPYGYGNHGSQRDDLPDRVAKTNA